MPTTLVTFCLEAAFYSGLLKEKKGGIAVTGRRRRRRRKLLEEVTERRGYSHCAVEGWRKSVGPIVREMKKCY